MTIKEAKEQIAKMQGLTLKPYSETLNETLAALGITHRPDKELEYTGRHILEKDGLFIGGPFTAHETWQWLATYLQEPQSDLAGGENSGPK